MKIFVIGFNKTGTTSLHNLFDIIKIKSIHTIRPIIPIIDNYDAFSDGDHYNFEQYYNIYPNSLFILNTRPIFNWLISRYKHADAHKFKPCWCWPISDERTNKWISDREKHYKNILNFFADKPDQLLIVNIEKNGWENVVLKFINKENNKFPNFTSKKNVRENKTIKQIENIKKNVSNCLKIKNYNGSELLFNHDISINNYITYL